MQQGLRQDQALLHPARQTTADRLALVTEIDFVETFADSNRALLLVEPVGSCVEIEKLSTLQIARHGSKIRHVAEHPSRLLRLQRNVDPTQKNLTEGRLH